MHKSLFRIAVTGWLACINFAGLAQPNPNAVYQVKNKESSKVIDVPARSNIPGTQIWVYNMNFTSAQRVTFYKDTDGFYYIQIGGGMCLTVDIPALTTQVGSSHAAEPAIYTIKQDVQYPKPQVPVINPRGPNPDAQKWKVTYQNDALTYTFESKLVKGYVMEPMGDTSKAYIRLSKGNGSARQKWIINALGTPGDVNIHSRSTQWVVYGGSPTLPESGYPIYTNTPIAFFNIPRQESLVYGHQTWGTDLDWTTYMTTDIEEFEFRRRDGTLQPIQYGDSLALFVVGHKYLHYHDESWGPNIGYTDDPEYGWIISGRNHNAYLLNADTIPLVFYEGGVPFTDSLINCHQDYGIDLNWSAHCKLPTPLPVTTMPQLPPVKSIQVFNCSNENVAIHLWTLDVSTGAFKDFGLLGSQWVDGEPCPPPGSSPTNIDLIDGDTYYFYALYGNCSGNPWEVTSDCFKYTSIEFLAKASASVSQIVIQ